MIKSHLEFLNARDIELDRLEKHWERGLPSCEIYHDGHLVHQRLGLARAIREWKDLLGKRQERLDALSTSESSYP